MGEVYRARDPRLGARRRAQGASAGRSVDQDEALDRLLREATLASALNHPNIVTIYDTGVVGDDRYIAMELVEGTTLRELAAKGLALERVVSIAKQVAEALAVAHARQHRPPRHQAGQRDGAARRVREAARLRTRAPSQRDHRDRLDGSGDRAGLIIGTIGYMSPEQARGDRVAPEADIFAFGVVLYELVTGRHPFMAASQLGTLHALMWENAGAAVADQSRDPAPARAADRRGDAEGSAAASGRRRPAVSAERHVRFDGRGRAVDRDRRAALDRKHARRRRSRRRDGRASSRVRARAAQAAGG